MSLPIARALQTRCSSQSVSSMRAGVAISILAVSAWSCIIRTHAREYKSAKNIIQDAITCASNLGFSKCITAYGVWKAERALEPQASEPGFSWRNFVNVSNDELYSKLCGDTERLLRYRSLFMELSEDYAIRLKSTENASLNIDIIQNSDVVTGRTSMKKMTKMFYQALPFLIFPGLIMSAVLPFFLPTLKMATLATVMLNNMALTGAVFTLLRNNAFNDHKYPKRVIYVNAGYDGSFNHLAEGSSDDIVAANFDTQYSTEVTHDVKDYHLIGVDPNTGISYPFNADWLKNSANEVSKVKNVEIIGEVPSVNDWTKPNIKWRKHSNR
ncbi:uncharacterized protein LOC119834413 [Zerene cesonia]|uniref:uncharacterized protein LOC119834413 n=1 Tax=Zerene cesonia TaxID=33412 RepID=UPI0018E51034|nr:uncharacterized protein LOC119834413 [Zerene cesonia]